MPRRFWIETLGCPKNQVDSDKIAGSLLADGYELALERSDAELVVVNTCAFIEAAREESVETILALAGEKQPGARLVVTGCLASRAGAELAEALPEVDVVADVGVPVQVLAGPRFRRRSETATTRAALDFLEGPRRGAHAPWAYVKIAEGCDRRCGFCAIPSFRGPQVSRPEAAILEEVERLEAKEVVLVAQDLASYGRDDGRPGALADLVRKVRACAPRVRLLYLYPSALSDALVEVICESGLPYFDLSLQHVSGRLLRKMRRYGNAETFLKRIASIRALAPDAAFRSSFICGYPGETEEDHDALLAFLSAAELDWAGFFTFSEEQGTFAAGLADKVAPELAIERLRECAALQDDITASRRRALVGTTAEVLIDAPGVARSHREAPEIDGIIAIERERAIGSFTTVRIVEARGTDLVGVPVDARDDVAAVALGA